MLSLNSSAKNRLSSIWSGSDRMRSIVFVLCSVALFSVTSLLAKMLGGEHASNPLNPFQISGFRFVIAFLTIALVLYWRNASVRNIQWGLHIGRSVFGWLGVTCLFGAATQIPLADANAISFLSVIVAMALSMFWLGEKVGVRRWSAAGIALLGALLIARPGTSAFDIAAIIAFLAALFIGIEAIFLKKLSNRDDPIQILFCNNMIGAALSIVALFIVWKTPSLMQLAGLVAIGVIMLLAQFLNILALQQEEASFLMPFWYATPVFSAVYDYLLFNQIVSTWSAAGMMLIFIGGVIISLRSRPSFSKR